MCVIISYSGQDVKGKSANRVTIPFGFESRIPFGTFLLREIMVEAPTLLPATIRSGIVAHVVVPIERRNLSEELVEGHLIFHVAHYSRVRGVCQASLEDFSLFDVDPVAASTPGAKLAAHRVLTLPLEGALRNPLFGLLHSTLQSVVQRGVANALVVLTVGGHVDVHGVVLHVCIIPCAGGYVKPFFSLFQDAQSEVTGKGSEGDSDVGVEGDDE